MAQPEALLDPDVLSTGASALTHGLSVVTNNEDHFKRIPCVEVLDWLRP